jgi:hypothetical protein
MADPAIPALLIERGIALWVIYDHPSDFPTGYVLRRQVARAGTVTPDRDAVYAPTLQAARAALPPGLLLLHGPGVDPDPKIHEVWI